MKVSPDELNRLLQEKWSVKFDDFEFIEPFLDIITNVDITGRNQPSRIYKVHKRHFSLNPFWSSPDMLEFTKEQYVLIALKNACSHITVYELAELFGIEEVEKIYFDLKNNNHFKTKKCRAYIEQGISLAKEEKEILANDIHLSFPKSMSLFIQKKDIACLENNVLDKEVINQLPSLQAVKTIKVLLLMDRDKIRDMYDVAYMLQNGILKPKEMLKIIARYRLTFDENYVLMRLSHKKPSENDEGLDELMANPPSFKELKEYLITQTKKGMIEIRKDFHKKRSETQTVTRFIKQNRKREK